MNIKELTELLDRRGPEPGAWPSQERARAEALLESSSEARAKLEESRRLARALAAYEVEPAGADLAPRIAAAAHAQATAAVSLPAAWTRPRFLLPQIAGLAAAALLGVYVGAANLLPGLDLAAEATEIEEAEDLSDLVFGNPEMMELEQ